VSVAVAVLLAAVFATAAPAPRRASTPTAIPIWSRRGRFGLLVPPAVMRVDPGLSWEFDMVFLR
jgi:hypothetical protein